MNNSSNRKESYYGVLDEFVNGENGKAYVRFDCFLKSQCDQIQTGHENDWLLNARTFAIEFDINLKQKPCLNFGKRDIDRWFNLQESDHGFSSVVTETSAFLVGEERTEMTRNFSFPHACDGRKSFFRNLSKMLSQPLKEVSSVEDVEKSFGLRQLESVPVGLSVYNVGQGSCCAIVDEIFFLPLVYFDLGTAWGFNAKTRPSKIKFCFTNDPAIILSHWDLDHWYAARFDKQSITRTWVVPSQKMKPSHSRFASEIKANGRLVVCPPGFGQISLSKISSKILQCTGGDQNNSGIALEVKFQSTSSEKEFTILATGDAEFQHIPGSGVGVDTFVAPHHGAKLSLKDIPKSTSAKHYAISFGDHNTYRHPDSNTRLGYMANGWTQPLETKNGGVILWRNLSRGKVIPNPACGKLLCTFDVTQS